MSRVVFGSSCVYWLIFALPFRPLGWSVFSWVLCFAPIGCAVQCHKKNATGSNTVSTMAFLMATWMFTSSLLLIPLRIRLCVINYVQSNVGWILPTAIRTSMDHLTLQLFAAAKLATALIKSHGMHWLPNPRCFQTKSLGSTFLHIPSMWTMAFIWYSLGW